MRLYQALQAKAQKELPPLTLGDSTVNAMVKNYVTNDNFGKPAGTSCNWPMKP